MVIVDRRSGSKDLLGCTALDGRAVEGELDSGDVLLAGNGPQGGRIMVGVELKKMADLISSISTGRLGGTQLPRMIKEYDYNWILSYGMYRPGPDNRLQVRRGKSWRTYRIGSRDVPWAYIEGALLTYRMLGGVNHKHVYDLDEAARWIVILDNWLDKKKHKGLSVFDKSREKAAMPDTDPVEEQMARTAATFPGLDWERGWRAARHFQSVEAMVAADGEDWQEIDGIGPVIAENVTGAIRRRRDDP